MEQDEADAQDETDNSESAISPAGSNKLARIIEEWLLADPGEAMEPGLWLIDEFDLDDHPVHAIKLEFE
jgi:hypothetical protein